MTEPVLWAGLVMLGGALGAMAARAARLPAAAGALVAGFLAAEALGAGGGTGTIRTLLAAFLCLLLGMQLDLASLARQGRSIATTALAQAAAVMLFGWIAGTLLGMGWSGALLLGAGATAASPTAIVAATSEARARGGLTQRLLALSPLGLSLGAALACLSAGRTWDLTRLCGGLLAGVLCGAILLVPLSRMATRGAILTGAAGGAVLIALCCHALASPSALAPASALAGLVCGSLCRNRDLLRDALADLALPAGTALFALGGASISMMEAGEAIGALIPALLLVAARGAGLMLAVAARPGGPGGMGGSNGAERRSGAFVEAAALLPMAGASLMAPAALVAAMTSGEVLSARAVIATLAVAGFLSEAAGLVATRWALVRSGEGAALSDDPDAWRAAMR